MITKVLFFPLNCPKYNDSIKLRFIYKLQFLDVCMVNNESCIESEFIDYCANSILKINMFYLTRIGWSD